MEFSGDAIYDVYRSIADRVSGGTQYCIPDDGDRRTDKYYGVCNTDLMSLMMVTFVFVLIMIAEASTDRIEEVLKEVPEMQDKEDAVKEVPDGSISFENVDFSYAGEGGNLSLKNINIHIKSGQTIGIIGGTGSAKSTFVR